MPQRALALLSGFGAAQGAWALLALASGHTYIDIWRRPLFPTAPSRYVRGCMAGMVGSASCKQGHAFMLDGLHNERVHTIIYCTIRRATVSLSLSLIHPRSDKYTSTQKCCRSVVSVRETNDVKTQRGVKETAVRGLCGI